MKYTYYLLDDVLFINIKGDLLGLSEEEDIIRAVKIHLALSVNHCVIDVANLGYMNSRGVSIMIRILNLLERSEGNMVLMHLPPQLTRLMRITKLNQVFKFADTRYEALRLLE